MWRAGSPSRLHNREPPREGRLFPCSVDRENTEKGREPEPAAKADILGVGKYPRERAPDSLAPPRANTTISHKAFAVRLRLLDLQVAQQPIQRLLVGVVLLLAGEVADVERAL